jgi:hypothetical protein
MSNAERLLAIGLQSWGQSTEERCKAWQGALDEMGLQATVGWANGGPVCTGRDSDRAQGFINEVSRNWFKGRFEDEAVYIAQQMVKWQ